MWCKKTINIFINKGDQIFNWNWPGDGFFSKTKANFNWKTTKGCDIINKGGKNWIIKLINLWSPGSLNQSPPQTGETEFWQKLIP